MHNLRTRLNVWSDYRGPEDLTMDGLSPEEIVGKLAYLEKSLAGPLSYYIALAKQNSDELLATAGICALLDLDKLTPDLWKRTIEFCRHNAVRSRAFDLFAKRSEYDLARLAAKAPQSRPSDIRAEMMLATLNLDHERLVELNRLMFLQTGVFDHLMEASIFAETHGGWREALPWAVRMVLVNPLERRGAMRLLRLLKEANQFDLLVAVSAAFDRVQAFPTANTVIKAVIAQHEGKFREALKLLDKLNPKGGDAALQQIICTTTAQCHESLGDYVQASKWYAQQNKAIKADDIDPNRFFEMARGKARWILPPLPKDERTSHFLMLGFPRSGTTLLETALATHHQVETFEEIPSFPAMTGFLGSRINERRSEIFDKEIALQGRQRYYAEIDRRKTKSSAAIFVDKLPILSAEAAFLQKIFPEKSYIFSIRHPYDVVLSCFKQPFKPNAAMENFRTIEMSFRIYDFTMSQWFDHFSLDDNRVCYIRYEALVEDFRTQMSRVFEFLGTEWTEEVLEFASLSERRKVATPSYQKVRSGLSIGVQSSWRNYDFLFRLKEARLLDPWLKHFGYEGL